MPRFEINVVEANALPSADLNGKSDPYVEVCTATERQKTDVKKATLNPVWRETKIVSIANPNTDGIGFLVYDWDRIGANDIIAYGYISVIGVPMNGAPLDAWVALYKKSKKAKKAEKKAEKSAKSGKPPKPGVPGGRLHLIVRALDVVAMPPPPMAGMPPPGMPPQPMPGQPYPPQAMPGQPYPPQPMPGQPYPPQAMPGQPYPPPGAPMMAPAPMMAAPMIQPLVIQSPYRGAIPVGFQNKAGFLRPKKTDAEVAGKVMGKGAKKSLKLLGKILT